MSTSLLQFQQVVFQWPDETTPIIQEFNWTMEPGKAYLLDGPSGHGKTTFLRLAAGLLNPTRGKILRFTKKIGFAFQDQRLLPWLTAKENLTIAMQHVDDRLTDRLLECVGLAEKAKQNADTLSGGEAQRVNLLRALLNEPDLLLLDEPFNGLDEHSAEICAGLIRDWLQNTPNRGLILATHIQNFQNFCNAEKIRFSTNS